MATSADSGCDGWVAGVVVRRVEGVAEGVDGLVLEAETDVGVDGGGDADVGVSEEFLDHDEFDALFQEQGDGGVPESVRRPRRRIRMEDWPGRGGGRGRRVVRWGSG